MNPTQLSLFFQHIGQQLMVPPVDARRLFHGRGRQWSGLEQLAADWLSQQLIVILFKAPETGFIEVLKQGLQSLVDSDTWRHACGRCIAIQHRYESGAPLDVLWGQLDAHPIVEEDGLKYQLDIGRNQNFGLFLDMSLGRQWVKHHAGEKKVLNLFAYTCGFSVAAIEGGATQVVNLDMAKASLAKGRDNHKLNHHALNRVQFLGHDIFKSWGKLKKYGPYDLIIIDPPTFQKGSFVLTKDYCKILRRLNDLLAEKGTVLACVNAPSVNCSFLIDSMAENAPFLTFQQRLENPPEFEDIDPQASLKALVFQS